MTSFRAFAKAIGVSHQAVSKGARTGRLSASLGHDRHGRPCIADVALARREWRANASQPPPEREFPDVDVEALVIDLVEFVLVRHLPAAILSRHKDGGVDGFDSQMLADFLARERAR
jgi:hypothetical protein